MPSHFGFVVLAAGNALLILVLWYSLQAMPSPFLALWHSPQAMLSHFWLCGIRYRRGPSTVRNTHSVLKTGSWGTRRIFRGIRCKKQASTVRKGYSVRRTASCGTRRIMDIRYSPPSLVRNRSLDAKKGHHRNNTKEQDKSCDLSCLVEPAIAISNSFIDDYRLVCEFQFA